MCWSELHELRITSARRIAVTLRFAIRRHTVGHKALPTDYPERSACHPTGLHRHSRRADADVIAFIKAGLVAAYGDKC